MTDHTVGEELVIRWPGGPHDYKIEYYDNGQLTQPRPSRGFQYIRGVVIEPDFGSHWRTMRTFYVRPLGNGEYSLLPMMGPAGLRRRPGCEGS